MTVDIFATNSGFSSADGTRTLLSCTVCNPQIPVAEPSTNSSTGQENQTTEQNSTNETNVTTNQSNNETTIPSFSLIVPPTTIVGQNVTFNTGCPTCTLQVKGPDGKVILLTPDSVGKFTLPLALAGGYQVSLLSNGTVLKTLNLNAAGGSPVKTTNATTISPVVQ
ncbi:MAG: hypothetical protein HZC29_00565, partial [Thaumarchaeota archaeon]|nr:hypothetical protein [Nitrososphaerota archaeon]